MNQKKMYNKCSELIGKGRRHQPHDRINHKRYQPCSSPMGVADEDCYTCVDCGQKLMYETGSCGYGWMPVDE